MIVFVVLGADTQPGLLLTGQLFPFVKKHIILTHQTNTDRVDDSHRPPLFVDNLAVQQECRKTPNVPAGYQAAAAAETHLCSIDYL